MKEWITKWNNGYSANEIGRLYSIHQNTVSRFIKSCGLSSKRTIKQRFIRKVIKTNNCWEWNGSKDTKGYGYILDGKNKKAHRVSYEIYNGKIPEGMVVMHKCDNPSCVNPKHLAVGTVLDNHNDKMNKGRQARGEKMNTAKLTESDVREIINLSTQGYSDKEICQMFNITVAHTGLIRRRLSWKHLTK